MWLEFMKTHMFDHVENAEVLKLLSISEVDVCENCQTYYTLDGEVVMDVFKCDSQQEFCLNCCGCPEHEEGAYWL